MPDTTRGPSHDPTRLDAPRTDPGAARTPPDRPDERSQSAEEAERIATGAPARTPSGEESSNETAFASPEELARGGARDGE